jgi:predicted DNA-binding protein YlxM (UPF0122 family)
MFYKDRYYYVTQIASTLRVTRQAIYNFIKLGKLHPEKGLKPLRISGEEIIRFMGGNSV